jgi:hypothetical protein
VQLTSFSANFIHSEATLYNRMTNVKVRLRDEEPFDIFEVRDAEDHVVLRGKVKAIERRYIDFTAGDKQYRLPLGHTLHEVLRPDRLSQKELMALTLNPTAGEKH